MNLKKGWKEHLGAPHFEVYRERRYLPKIKILFPVKILLDIFLI